MPGDFTDCQHSIDQVLKSGFFAKLMIKLLFTKQPASRSKCLYRLLKLFFNKNPLIMEICYQCGDDGPIVHCRFACASPQDGCIPPYYCECNKEEDTDCCAEKLISELKLKYLEDTEPD